MARGDLSTPPADRWWSGSPHVVGGRAPAPTGPAGTLTSGSVRIHPAALEEAEEATGWYQQRSRRAAELFLDELDRAIERIGENPRQFPEYEFGTRRIVLRRFPYLVVFRETADGAETIAVAHGHRTIGGSGSMMLGVCR